MHKPNIVVRDYCLGDEQALANIFYNTIHKVNIRHYSQEQVDVWAPERSLDGSRWVPKFEKTKPFVAMAGETIVGFAEFEQDGHIDCFYCHHEWIGCGAGSAMMNAIFARAKEWNITRIFSEVSITAKTFFEKQGFSVVKEQTIVKDGTTFINYKMERNG